ncbi:Gfo/Idh/MocA family protein [Jannaschia aquimarina]|uniref:LigC protein n=1 Tax=Jannaschia aquimarina TaxID=935700 RepID=A0A0D1CQW8_9RHOB|nr:Gfo/Idh/MocA family oxidoreductase [Jannaschia aquimarina]KIT17172.1 4-carboxy-2-hydroxymuconate-6-semialdehyde dehydrogenase [Jannaschia aquimarina]SNT17771.1 Predicted dehydrogenase [Jannaschia aquimarina]
MSLNVALVGCGRIARALHGPILSRLPAARLSAIVDPDGAARMAMSRIAPGAVLHADLESVLQAGEADAVVICTPPEYHAEATLAALDAGLPVYVEKPLAPTEQEAEALIAARQVAGTVGIVGHNFRFHPEILSARDRIASGELGAPVAIRSVFTSERRALPDWKLKMGGGGDALTDLGSHHVDLFGYLSGQAVDPGSVQARQKPGPDGSAATLSASLDDGTPLSLTVAQTSGVSVHRIEILCEKAHLEIDLVSGRATMSRSQARLGTMGRWQARIADGAAAVDPRHRPDPSFEAALSHFVTVAAGGDPAGSAVPADFRVGARAMTLLRSALD